ncbi:MAG TPA: outer membrane beta-barrel domain-containing protein, partial [Vicinamibacterales bacterium]
GGGYALSRHTSVADAASQTIVKDNPTKSAKVVDDFSDLWQMTWSATGAIRWTPIYGKASFFSLFPFHFQFYLTLGGGAGGMKRDSLVYCVGSRPSSAVTCGNREDDDLRPLHQEEIKPVILGGFGMKFFILDWLGFRVEVRDMMFPDSFREKIDRAAAERDTAANEGNAPAQGTPSANPGFTHLVFANIGFVFTF